MTAPAPGQPASDPLVDGSPEQLTERALVSALVHDHRRLDDIADWLRGDDFLTSDARAVYETLLGLRAARELSPIPTNPTAEQLRETTLAVVIAVRHTWEAQRFTDVRCPRHHDPLIAIYTAAPDGPSQHLEHARDVLVDAARRRLAEWGLRLQHVTSSEPTLDGDLTHLANTTTAMTADLAELRTHLGAPQHRLAHALEPQPTAHTSPGDHLPAPAALAPVPPAVLQHAIRQVVHAVLTNPAPYASAVLDRFAADELNALPAYANTWRAMQSLHHRNARIDYVSVARELRALGNLIPALTPNDLARIATSTPPHIPPATALRTIAQSALAHHAHQAHQHIHAAATDHSTTVDQLADTTTQAATTVEHHARRLAGHPEGAERSFLQRRLTNQSHPARHAATQ